MFIQTNRPGSVACVFAFTMMPLMYALLKINSDEVLAIISLILIFMGILGLLFANQGLRHPRLFEKIMAIIAALIMTLELLIMGCVFIFTCLVLLWRALGGGGITPFM